MILKQRPFFFLKLKLFNDTFDYEIISGLFSNSNKYTTSITLSVLCTCTSFERFGIYIFSVILTKKKNQINKTAEKLKLKHKKTQLKQIIKKYNVVLILTPAKLEYSLKKVSLIMIEQIHVLQFK